MAVLDLTRKTMTLKIVYYGCAMGGKTTNLLTLYRLTDPDATHGMVSIATKDDRTLFFDLLPMDLGQVGGLKILAKVYTVPGQVQYEATRKQVLTGADAVVLVVDSTPEARQSNLWTAESLRSNLKSFNLDPNDFPTILQWNKRDLPEAVPVSELAVALNPGNLPAFEAVATSGAGVVDTFAAALEGALVKAYSKQGRHAIPADVLRKTINEALSAARSRAPDVPKVPASSAFEHRVETQIYQGAFGGKGIDRTTLDQQTLLVEAVQTGMELAEKLDGLCDVAAENERRKTMISALGRLASILMEPSATVPPRGLMKALLEAAGRSHGSLLLFRPNEKTMDEREVVPEGRDPLNSAAAAALGSAAFRLAQIGKPRFVENLVAEVFFDAVPPSATGLAWAFVTPIACDGIGFGGLAVYGTAGKHAADDVEREYWAAAGTLVGLVLHWRALKRKIAAGSAAQPRPAGAANPTTR